MSDQNNDSTKYGEDWVPTPDDPNYEAYLKYQQNLKDLESNAAETDSAPGQIPAASQSSTGYQRPHVDNPDAEASDHIGPIPKPSHWSDKPNPDAPWWANPYTYVGPGEWRKPNWGGVDPQQAEEEEDEIPTEFDPSKVANNEQSQQRVWNPYTQQPGEAAEVSGAAAGEQVPPATGAWVPSGDATAPWTWDATATPNQEIDGKPCCVPAGAWIPTNNPASPWMWNASVLPNQYLDGKPVFVDPAQQAPAGQAAQPQAGPAVHNGAPNTMFGADMSAESGEGRPDVPWSSRIMWFFVGMFAGLFGMIFAWMVTARYPMRQRKQVTRSCWLGLACWCLFMLVMMQVNGGDGSGLFGFFGGGSTGAESTGGSGSSSAF